MKDPDSSTTQSKVSSLKEFQYELEIAVQLLCDSQVLLSVTFVENKMIQTWSVET